MDNTNRHFKGQLATEKVQCFCRKHWIVLLKDFIGFFIFLSLITVTAIYFKGIFNFLSQDSFFSTLLAFGIFAVFTVYLHRFFLRMIRYFLEIMIVTNYRIVLLEKSLYLKDSKDAVDLPKIQDIRKEQHGIIKSVLRFGTLVITLSSTSTTKVIPFVPNPDYHFRKINSLKRDYIKGRLGKRDKGELKQEKQEVSENQGVHPVQPISALADK
ncbi:hypothetical protein ACFL3C_05330 [Patescibacteria group bacterium]